MAPRLNATGRTPAARNHSLIGLTVRGRIPYNARTSGQAYQRITARLEGALAMGQRISLGFLLVLTLCVATPCAQAQEIKRPRYIAVLPFKNLKKSTDADYWHGAGAAETVTTKLGGSSGR